MMLWICDFVSGISVYVANVHKNGDRIILVHVPEYSNVLSTCMYIFYSLHILTLINFILNSKSLLN